MASFCLLRPGKNHHLINEVAEPLIKGLIHFLIGEYQFISCTCMKM